jgi:hypothetical protein
MAVRIKKEYHGMGPPYEHCCICRKPTKDIGEFYSDGSGPRTEYIGQSFLDDIPRNEPLLIKCIEELGQRADGQCARLKIIEIPENVDWAIGEHDGYEYAYDKQRFWD